MNNRKYLAIGLIILMVLGLGCVANKPSTSEKTPISNKVEQTNIVPTSTPIPTEEQKSIIIKYSDKKMDSIRQFSKPKSGNTFLIITMTIENHGYDKFNTNQLWFSVIYNNVKHDSSFDSASLQDKLDMVDLLDGGSTKGSIAFEVPSSITEYKLQYKGVSDYNIIYQKE